VHVTPYTSPRPVRSFLQLGLHSALLAAITSAGYEQPTAIQAQTIPVVLSGSDVIALAKTGAPHCCCSIFVLALGAAVITAVLI
jgi:superfamily II DNA/RNA helicase